MGCHEGWPVWLELTIQRDWVMTGLNAEEQGHSPTFSHHQGPPFIPSLSHSRNTHLLNACCVAHPDLDYREGRGGPAPTEVPLILTK